MRGLSPGRGLRRAGSARGRAPSALEGIRPPRAGGLAGELGGQMGSGEQPGGSRDAPSGLEAGGERGPACGTWRALGAGSGKKASRVCFCWGVRVTPAALSAQIPHLPPRRVWEWSGGPAGSREEEAPGSATACLVSSVLLELRAGCARR